MESVEMNLKRSENLKGDILFGKNRAMNEPIHLDSQETLVILWSKESFVTH